MEDDGFESWGEDEWDDFLWGRENAAHLDYALGAGRPSLRIHQNMNGTSYCSC